LKQCLHLPFGGQDIIFAGDMCQLEPVEIAKELFMLKTVLSSKIGSTASSN